MRSEATHQADEDSDDHAESDRLDGGGTGASEVLFAYTPRHHGRGAHAQPDGEGVEQRQKGLGKADRRRGGCTEPHDEEDVDDREHRLHRHLEHHRD